MTAYRSATGRRQRGVAALEFALIFTLFFGVLYGAATFGAIFYTQQVVSRAAEDGARAISLLGVSTLTTNDPGIKTIVYKSLSGSLIAPSGVGTSESSRNAWLSNPSNVTVSVATSCPGVAACAKVTVEYQYSRNRILPLLPLLVKWVVPDTLKASAFSTI